MVKKAAVSSNPAEVDPQYARYASIHSRIRECREAAGLSMHALADLVGVRAWQTIQQWEREPGGTAPRRERLQAVANALNTTAEYLLFGRRPSNEEEPGIEPAAAALTRASPSGDPRAVRLDASKARPVFVVDTSRSLENEEQYAGDSKPVSSVKYASIATDDPGAFLIPVTDATMSPRYRPGEHVLVEPGEKYEAGDDVYVQLRRGERMIRELMSLDGLAIELAAHNCPGEPRVRIPVSDVQFIYYVSHAVPPRRIKTLSLG